jgi:cell division protease FtsH
MVQNDGTAEFHRPSWWRTSKVWWLVGLAALLMLLMFVIFENAHKVAPIPYSAFLDQLEAGNVASVTFQGYEITGRLKHPVGATSPGPASASETFTTRVPEVGDSALVREIRNMHVAIDVRVPSLWTSLIARLPWPMLAFLAVMAVAGLVRLLRGGKPQSGQGGSSVPARGMMGLISGLVSTRRKSNDPGSKGADTH